MNLPIPVDAGFTLKSSFMMKSTKLTIVLLFCIYHSTAVLLPPITVDAEIPTTLGSRDNEHPRIQ